MSFLHFLRKEIEPGLAESDLHKNGVSSANENTSPAYHRDYDPFYEAIKGSISEGLISGVINGQISKPKAALNLIIHNNYSEFKDYFNDFHTAFEQFCDAREIRHDLPARAEIAVYFAFLLRDPEIESEVPAGQMTVIKRQLENFFSRAIRKPEFQQLDNFFITSSYCFLSELTATDPKKFEHSVSYLLMAQRWQEHSCPADKQNIELLNNLFSSVAAHVVMSVGIRLCKKAWDSEKSDDSSGAYAIVDRLDSKLQFIKRADKEFSMEAAVLKDTFFVLKAFFAFHTYDFSYIKKISMDRMEHLDGDNNRLVGILVKNIADLMDSSGNNPAYNTPKAETKFYTNFLESADPSALFLGAQIFATAGSHFLNNKQVAKANLFQRLAVAAFEEAAAGGVEVELWRYKMTSVYFDLAVSYYKLRNYSDSLHALEHFNSICPKKHHLKGPAKFALAFFKYSKACQLKYLSASTAKNKDYEFENSFQSALETNPLLSEPVNKENVKGKKPYSRIRLQAMIDAADAFELTANPAILSRIKAFEEDINEGKVSALSTPF